MPDLEQYRAAEKLVDQFKVCSGGSSKVITGGKIIHTTCKKVFDSKEEGGVTIYYGTQKWWCGEHYESAMRELKEDMKG